MTLAIILFAVTYILMIAFGKYRPYIALSSGIIFIATMLIGGLNPLEAVGVLDFNVLLMIAGTMGLVQMFIDSKMPARLADIVINLVPNVCWAAVSLSLFAGIISAFVDNVATVLMVAPVAMAICKKLDTNPVPFIIAIAVSSNLQGAATLVGDTTAIMMGSAMDMSFFDFFWFEGKPSIFFAVELGALLSAAILWFLFRKEKGLVQKNPELTPVNDYVPSILLLGTIGLLVVVSFAPESLNLPKEINGIIACAMLVVGLIYNIIRYRKKDALLTPIKAIDFETLGLLIGLFMMIGGIKHYGVIDALANLLAKLGGGNLFLLYTVIVWASVLISAFIDNIPYVATMIPIIGGMGANIGLADLLAEQMHTEAALIAIPLYFGLLSGATLGGNITPIGASANITGIGILRRAGYEVKNSDFFKIGIPFTLAAVVPAYIYIWLIYGVAI